MESTVCSPLMVFPPDSGYAASLWVNMTAALTQITAE
jgi:hypothetical protein